MTVCIKREHKILSPSTWTIKKWMQTILDSLNCGDKELSILLVNDKKMKQLNTKYRNENCATDVLSFSQDQIKNKSIPPLMGDIVVSTEAAERQAKIHNLTIDEEIALLLIHGILHLLGYDHEASPSQKNKMRIKTRDLFKKLFPNTSLDNAGNF